MNLPMIQSSATGLAARVAKAKVPATANSGSGGFLKFDFNSGEWTYGRDLDEVTNDLILINTNTICHGYILWHESKATKVLTTFDTDMPEAPAPKGSDQPSEARAFAAAFYDDGKPGEAMTFETNSFGGRKAVDGVIKLIIEQVTAGETINLYPLVKLTSESYRNKTYHNKLIHNPAFEIVGWCDQNGVRASADAPPQIEAPEAAPPAEEPAAPARRRRVV